MDAHDDHENDAQRPMAVSRRGLAAAFAGAGLALAPANSVRAAPRKNRLSAEDRLDILELLARYAWAYDCGDAEAYADTFTEDGLFEGTFGEQVVGRTAIRDYVQTLMAPRGADMVQHHNDHVWIEGEGDRCTVYCYWMQVQQKAGEKTCSVRNIGYYVSECVKIDDIWYFKKRSIPLWNGKAIPWKA
jgi:uncharacterized protein (TIGR02246 family)